MRTANGKAVDPAARRANDGSTRVGSTAISFLRRARTTSEATALVEEARWDVATDEELIERNRSGDARAAEVLLSRYRNFARMKARSYFLVGAERDDVQQEGMIGLYKAIRDFQVDRQSSFRAFADMCITRQLITAIRSARCRKHQPLNSYVSLSKPLEAEDDHDRALLDVLKGPWVLDPAEVVIATEDLGEIKAACDELLSEFETAVLQRYADGKSYQEIGLTLGRDSKSIDNALQRIKRKIEVYLRTRNEGGSHATGARRPRVVPAPSEIAAERAASA